MPTLVLNNMPARLYDQIHRLAEARQRTPVDTVLEVLETALGSTGATSSNAPLPAAPYLTEEVCAPCGIPWPAGVPAHAIQVDPPLPDAHDVPE